MLLGIFVSINLLCEISEVSLVSGSSSTLDENIDADALKSRPSLSKARSSTKWLSSLSLSTWLVFGTVAEVEQFLGKDFSLFDESVAVFDPEFKLFSSSFRFTFRPLVNFTGCQIIEY